MDEVKDPPIPGSGDTRKPIQPSQPNGLSPLPDSSDEKTENNLKRDLLKAILEKLSHRSAIAYRISSERHRIIAVDSPDGKTQFSLSATDLREITPDDARITMKYLDGMDIGGFVNFEPGIGLAFNGWASSHPLSAEARIDFEDEGGFGDWSPDWYWDIPNADGLVDHLAPASPGTCHPTTREEILELTGQIRNGSVNPKRTDTGFRKAQRMGAQILSEDLQIPLSFPEK